MRTLDDLRDELFQVMDRSKYSDAQDTLKEVYTILNFYRHVQKELQHESHRLGDKEGSLENHEAILEGLENDMDDKLRVTQRSTALRVLQRFYRHFETSEVQIQTMPEEDQIRVLQEIVNDKEDQIRSYKEQLVQATVHAKELEERLANQVLKHDTLNQQFKQRQKLIVDMKEEMDAKEAEIETTQSKLRDAQLDNYDFKKKLDHAQEELAKTKASLQQARRSIISEGHQSTLNLVPPPPP